MGSARAPRAVFGTLVEHSNAPAPQWSRQSSVFEATGEAPVATREARVLPE
jgi:hypothetical protein